MKTIGIIGGAPLESTILYYRELNEMVAQKYGPYNSAKVIIYSIDLEKYFKYKVEKKWDSINKLMIEAAKSLENAGADFLIIAANIIHFSLNEVEKHISIPFINMINEVGEELKRKKIKKIALIGLKKTKKKQFYKETLQHYGVESITPAKKDVDFIHKTICKELIKGIHSSKARKKTVNIIKALVEQGAEGVVLATIQLTNFIRQEHIEVPLFVSSEIHLKKIFEVANLK